MSHHSTSSNNPSTMALYDRFIESLTSPRTPDSSTRSNRSETTGSEFEEGSSNAGRNGQSFLEKIYEPVPDPSKVYGFDYDKMSLKMLLLNERNQNSFNLLGVVGMVGVGKTTLCRSIFDEEQVKQRFVPRIQITMSEELKSMKGVVERMLQHLGPEKEFINVSPDDLKLPRLLYALHLRLKGKRYLILLDDVRDKDPYYEELKSCLRDGHGFPKSHGAAIIVTSRHEEAIKTMVGEQNLHRLLPLSDPDSCWPIYLNAARDNYEAPSSKSDTPKEVKEELKKKCGGVPLAARIMGELKLQEALKEKDSEKAPTLSVSEDGPIDQAPKISGDGSNSKDASPASKNGLDNQGDGPNEATASNKSDLQTATDNKSET